MRVTQKLRAPHPWHRHLLPIASMAHGGLGLSVAHGIVREHGGRLWAENSPSGGARFIVELPLGLRASEALRLRSFRRARARRRAA